MCAFSAEHSFVDSAATNFTGLGRNGRLHSGLWSLALLLDPAHQPIATVPGVGWAYAKENPPFKLMHAKVALLGFGESARGEPDSYRLIVFTGNWTKEAVNRSVNLVWHCDLNGRASGDKKAAADVTRAVAFWRRLLRSYCLAPHLRDRIGSFLSQCDGLARKKAGSTRPRFVSNALGGGAASSRRHRCDGPFVAQSIGAQVVSRILATKKRRNFICCGSGFFEESHGDGGEPGVLVAMLRMLTNAKGRGLTASIGPDKMYLVLNPRTAGAAGQWLISGGNKGIRWTTFGPGHPELKEAEFHAKYVFVANWEPRTERFVSGLLYLGSANLSKQGFELAPGSGGNVEAGVFLDVSVALSEKDLRQRLGFSSEPLGRDDIKPETEPDEIDPLAPLPPPPISFCRWDRGCCKLTWDAPQNVSNWDDVHLCGRGIKLDAMSLSLDDGEPGGAVELSAVKRNRCSPSRDRNVRWDIPVYMADGAGPYVPPPRTRSLGGVLDAIAGFGVVSTEEDDDTDDPPDAPPENLPEKLPERRKRKKRSGRGPSDLNEEREELAEYPLHWAATLVERMADKNQTVSRGQVPDWVAHLERTLILEAPEELQRKMNSVGVDFLRHLKSKPGLAPRESSEEYRDLIDKLMSRWRGGGESHATEREDKR